VNEAYAARRATRPDRSQRVRPDRQRDQAAVFRMASSGQSSLHASTPGDFALGGRKVRTRCSRFF